MTSSDFVTLPSSRLEKTYRVEEQLSCTLAKTILCVDDDVEFLRMLGTYMKAFGYSVVTENSGRAAIARAATEHISTAVLDYFMPNGNGGEIANELYRLQPDTRIILFTGTPSAVPNRVKAIVDGVVNKTEGIEGLVAALAAVPPERAHKPVRQFPRYAVALPIAVTHRTPGPPRTIPGVTTTVAEGGIGSVLRGEILPGDSVLLKFRPCSLIALGVRARVTYRNGATYGFEFVSLTSSQQALLHQSCEQWRHPH